MSILNVYPVGESSLIVTGDLRRYCGLNSLKGNEWFQISSWIAA
jgi:hypothetical protein